MEGDERIVDDAAEIIEALEDMPEAGESAGNLAAGTFEGASIEAADTATGGASPNDLPSDAALQRQALDLPLTSLVAMLGGWVLIYLVQNTDNPLSQLLHLDAESFLLEGQALDYLVYVGGHLGLLAVAVGLLALGLGPRTLPDLVRLPRSLEERAPEGAWWRMLLTPIGLCAASALALLAATVLGYRLAYALPDRYLLETPYTLADFEFEAVGVAMAVGLVRLVRISLWQLWVLVPLSLVMRTGVVDLHNPRHAVAVAGVLFVGGGLALASPSTGTVVYYVALYGLPAVACGASYLATRSWTTTVFLCWVAFELLAWLTYTGV